MKIDTINKQGILYIQAVKKQLPIPNGMSKKLLDELGGSVDEYVQDNPNATMDELAARFGDPETIADEYISALDKDRLKAEIKKSRLIKRAIITIAIVLIIAILTTFTVKIIQSESNVPRYRDVNIIDHDGVDE
jgi:hypothetical protein